MKTAKAALLSLFLTAPLLVAAQPLPAARQSARIAYDTLFSVVAILCGVAVLGLGVALMMRKASWDWAGSILAGCAVVGSVSAILAMTGIGSL